MSSLFDGMGALISATFGATVTVTPVGGPPRMVDAVFREGPITVLSQDGVEVTTVIPTLVGEGRLFDDLVPDGVVDPGNGKTYRCIFSQPSGSPAVDALITIQLERL